MVTAKDIPNDRLVRLADAHVCTFERRVAMGKAGARVVNVDECERYLELWRGAREKLMAGVELNATEIGEIQDAIDCGDYDALLAPDPAGPAAGDEWRLRNGSRIEFT